jgi:hypothetical protein
METFGNIDNIILEAEKLDKKDQINLLKKLLELVKKTEVLNKSTSVSLTSLSGLGSDIWINTDIDSYIENERQW